MAESAEFESDTVKCDPLSGRSPDLPGSLSVFWLGWLDSNQRMVESESAALPLGYSDTLSPEDLDDIAYLMSDAEVEKVAQKHGITIEGEEEDEFWEDPAPQRKRSGIGLFGALLIGLSLFGGKPRSKKKHNGRCDGDCANCPPHYGYRYGRWYYGRHHQYGCQFGGNHGGGGLD